MIFPAQHELLESVMRQNLPVLPLLTLRTVMALTHRVAAPGEQHQVENEFNWLTKSFFYFLKIFDLI